MYVFRTFANGRTTFADKIAHQEAGIKFVWRLARFFECAYLTYSYAFTEIDSSL
jgi:hypothetical protein